MTQVSLPTNLFDASGFRWDISGNGNINDGTNDAYDGGLNLREFPFLPIAQTEDNDREIVIGSTSINGVEVTRKIYVPGDQSFARFLEIVTNTSSSTVNFTVNLDTNLGSDSGTVLVNTSSGDTIFNTDDNWLVTDDSDGGGDPTLLHVFAGEGGIRPDAASLSSDNLNFGYNLTLAPGETQIVMHFASQNFDRATALTKGPELQELGFDALAGMSNEELAQVVNFSIPVGPPTEFIGTSGDDVLVGTNGTDIISGLGGDDTILALAGNDQIFGGNGDDLIQAGDGNDTVDGGSGDDQISGEAGNDTITGGNGLDVIFGGDGNDIISGGSGNDRIFGENGNDTINGDAGNDIINSGDGDDLVSGGTGKDRIFGGAGSDQLFGDAGNDSLNGDSGFDIIDGGDGNDFLFGGSEDDTLNGGAGTDTLDGGTGFDTLNGGDGRDTLTGVDTILGFGTGEIDTLTGGLGRDTFILGDATRVYYDDGNALTTGESDYAFITDFNASQDTIQLHGSANLYSLDFFTSSLGSIDAALIYDPGVTARGEVIGIIQNVSTNLNITSHAFAFV